MERTTSQRNGPEIHARRLRWGRRSADHQHDLELSNAAIQENCSFTQDQVIEFAAEVQTTTSLKVAAVFGKDHARVLSRIRTLVADLGEGYEAYFGFMFVGTDIGQGATRKDLA